MSPANGGNEFGDRLEQALATNPEFARFIAPDTVTSPGAPAAEKPEAAKEAVTTKQPGAEGSVTTDAMPTGRPSNTDEAYLTVFGTEYENLWRRQRLCRDDEETWRDPAYRSYVTKLCMKRCTVREQCEADDLASGASVPGIRAGLTQEERLAMLVAPTPTEQQPPTDQA